MTISWQPPPEGNGIITGYQVSYTSYGGSECVHDAGNTTTTELIYLKPNTEYKICVRAYTGENSTPIKVMTLEYGELHVYPIAFHHALYKDIKALH